MISLPIQNDNKECNFSMKKLEMSLSVCLFCQMKNLSKRKKSIQKKNINSKKFCCNKLVNEVKLK